MTRTDALIQAAVRALNQNRAFLDALPETVSGVQIDIKIQKAVATGVHLAPRWHHSLALQSCGVAVDVDRYNFEST